MTESIQFDFGWQPRSYQREVYNSFLEGKRRAILVWHRRAGKDASMFIWTVAQALQVPGVYFIIYPTKVLGRKILWNGIDLSGRRMLNYIPRPAIIGEPNDLDMRVRVRAGENGAAESIIQVTGSDDPDSLVGTNPIGLIYSEYALQDPAAWNLMRPVLSENGGWAAFISTPRGKNHFWKLLKAAERLPEEWFVSIKTVDDTRRDAPGEDGSYVISPEDIERERRSGMPDDLIQQEYYCSFEGEISGAYYASLVEAAEREGRIGTRPWVPSEPVHVTWDIGFGPDAGVAIFFQMIGQEIVFIDCEEHKHKSLVDWAKLLRDKPYVYGYQVWPHDIKTTEFGSGERRLDVARKIIPGKHIVSNKLPVEEGIDQVRRMFGRFFFDRQKTGRLILALSEYKQEWDEQRQAFGKTPVHDWTSHFADAIRVMAQAFPWRTFVDGNTRQRRVEINFNPMGDTNTTRRYESDFSVF